MSHLQFSKLGFLFVVILNFYVHIVECKCDGNCNLALASYYVLPGDDLDQIGGYFNVTANDILSYNSDKIPDQDRLQAYIRIDVPFPCGCVETVNGSFLGHIFSYQFQKVDTYEKIAQNNYSDLTTGDLIQEFNGYNKFNVPNGAMINVPVNCSCGDSRVSDEYGLFITYPLRANDSLSSISEEFGLSASLLQRYNPGVNFDAQTGLVYIPGKDKSGKYPPFVSNSRAAASSGLSGGAIAGICIAAAGLIVVSVGFYLRCMRRKKTKDTSLPDHGSAGQAEQAPGTPGIIVDKSLEFSYEELAKATNDFNISYKIGEGGFGAVYYAELRGEKAAIKKMDMQASREFLAELKVLTHVHHLNLVRLLGYCVEGFLCLVYEYIDSGNLSEHLRSSGRDPLPWSTRVQIALDSARGLEYIHEHTVPVYVHRDIKPANILIDKNFLAKVADFGLAKLTEVGNATLPTRLVGTFGYMPPEYAQFGEVSPKVDVYAFGVVLFELISAKEAVVRGSRVAVESKGLVALFDDVLNQPDPNEICKLVDPRLGDDYPLDSVRQVAELARACTQENPQLRPSMRSVVVALATLSSTTESWDIDSFYRNGGLLNRVAGR